MHLLYESPGTVSTLCFELQGALLAARVNLAVRKEVNFKFELVFS